MRIFIDSSAFAKRYIQEAGTERVMSLCRDADEIFLSFLCFLEITSAFNRQIREGKIPKKHYLNLKSNLAADLEQATIFGFSPAVFQKTVYCLEQTPMKTLDAIQLATALESGCDLFVTADERQSRNAKSFKLNVESIS